MKRPTRDWRNARRFCSWTDEERDHRREMAQSTHSDGTPAGTTGWGFMSHGVGTPEKMHVTAGELDYNTGFDVKVMRRRPLYIAGYAFAVVGIISR